MAGGVAVPMADAVEALPPPECGGGESGRSPAASPEFEFWMVGKNPSSFPSPALLTADQLFSGGVVLPLHTLQASSPSPTDGDSDSVGGAGLEAPDAEAAQPLAGSGIAPTPDLPAVTFKWKDIFKANGGGGEGKERKKAERRVSSVSGNAELININIWPFSRSRSAGAAVSLSRAKPSPTATATGVACNAIAPAVACNANGTASAPAPAVACNANGTAAIAPASAPTPAVACNANGTAIIAPASAPAPAARKVSSAPCSRSNSRGESGTEPTIRAAIPAAAAAAAPAAVEEPAGGAGALPHVHVKEVGARTRLRTFFSKKVY